MNVYYDVIAKKHEIYDTATKRYIPSSHPDVILFYDDDREISLKFMKDYVKKNGFTLEDRHGKCSIADVILRERPFTGGEISRTPYIKLFDEDGNRRK